MSRTFSLLLVLAVGAGQAFASEREDLLVETFQNVNGSMEATIELDQSQLDNPSGWTFTDAYAGPQCVIIKKGGTVTTPPIAGFTGNAAFYFGDARPWVDPEDGKEPDWENLKPHALSVVGAGELYTTELDPMVSMSGSYCIYNVDETSRITLTASYDITLSSVSVYYAGLASGAMPWEDFTKFSHDSGEYYSPFDLILTPSSGSMCYDDGKHNILVYTLDGSEPTRTSPRYDGTPLHITQTTTVRTATIFGDGYMYIDSPHTYTFPASEIPDVPDATYNITVSKPGSLKAQLLELDVDFIEGLCIKGTINGEDLNFLCSAKGLMGRLAYLDMREVSFSYDDALYRSDSFAPEAGMGTSGTVNYYFSEYNSKTTVSTSPTTSRTDIHSNNLAGAFSYHPSLSVIILPEGMTSIGDNILQGCGSLVSVKLPENLKEIGNWSLQSEKLMDMELPASLEKIGNHAFGSMFKANIDLPNLVEIGKGAFEGTKLLGFKFNDKLRRIGEGAFAGTLLETIDMPVPPDTIKARTFADCLQLKSVTIGEGLLRLESGAFQATSPEVFVLPSSLVDIEPYSIPDAVIAKIEPEGGIRYIGKVAYDVAENIEKYSIKEGTIALSPSLFRGNAAKEIVVPSSVTQVGAYAFAYSGISKLPEMKGVTKWEEGLFEGCENLSRVVIPENITYLGDGVFKNCSSLWQIRYDAVDAECVSSSDSDGGIFGQRVRNPIEFDGIVIGENVKRIPKGLYNSNWGVKDVTFPSNVETIDTAAFYDCRNMERIYLSDNIRFIEPQTFDECRGLKEVHWPLALERVSTNAFRWCSSLKTVSLPEGTKVLESDAFGVCSGVTSIYLPSTLEYIGDSPFYYLPDSKVRIVSTSPVPLDADGRLWGFYDGVESVEYIKVPAESVDSYKAHSQWSQYADVIIPIEQITAPSEETITSFKDGLGDSTDLGDTVIGDVYVTVGEEDMYDETDGAIVLKSTVSDAEADAVGGMAPGKSDIANRFNGLVVKVPAGTGDVIVNCLTVGARRIAVKIGEGEPLYYTKDSKGEITAGYDVASDTYVYIYADDVAENTDTRADSRSADDCVRIYSIGVKPVSAGIGDVIDDSDDASPIVEYYRIDGLRVDRPTTPGLYIIRRANGSTAKVMIK